MHTNSVSVPSWGGPPAAREAVAAGPTARAATRPATRARAWPLVATVFAATSIVVGLIWDISWHVSIGRDTFWTPAHIAVYLGGVVGGLANAWVILRTTLAGTDAEHAGAVRVWGFYGPLGAFVSCWGAGAMLTSAPFDDWWHRAYGLDVQILSPPHVVLITGIAGIVAGAMLTALAYQNAAEGPGEGSDVSAELRTQHRGEAPTTLRGSPRVYRVAYAYAAGLLLTLIVVGFAQTNPLRSHSAGYYRAAALVLPIVLCAAARASRLRWPATATALVYMGVIAAMTWVLPLFPATPKLGPIYYNVTHMTAPGFPILLVVPAVATDLVLRRWGAHARGARGVALLGAAIGVLFVSTMLAVQWPFGTFMLSKASHNWFFAGDSYGYRTRETSYRRLGVFPPGDPTRGAFVLGLGWAAVTATTSAALGLAWGGWMRRVRR